MRKILLVDASLEVQNELTQAVGSRFELFFATACADARTLIHGVIFDLVILESELPDGSGFALCSEIRAIEALKLIPVIFLTDKNSLSDRIQGFKVGADDYVTKPFESIELIFRIEARLRKLPPPPEQGTSFQKYGMILSIPFQKASLTETRVTAGVEEKVDTDLKLTPTEFRLLYFFMKNEGTVLTRDELLATVWNGDVQVLSRTIDKHISTLKKKLASRAAFIQSIHSKGYRFSVPSTVTYELTGSSVSA